MKINKILAAGIAATLAVTSLSAVAGAEVQTKTFDVYRTKAGFYNYSLKFNADVNRTIASKLRQATTGKITIKDLDNYVRTSFNYYGFLAYLKENDPDKYQKYYDDPTLYNWGKNLIPVAVNITATGYQHIGDTATVTKTFKFTKDDNWAWPNNPNNGTWSLVVLNDKEPIYHDGEFCSYFFREITSLELEVQISGETLNEDEYNYWSWINNGGDASKRYIDLGDISVIEDNTVAAPVISYTYGAASETSNAADLANVQAEQAVDASKSYVKGTNTPDATMGYLVGASTAGTEFPKPATGSQALYTGSADKGDYLTAATANKIAATTNAVTYAVSDIKDKVVFAGTTDVSDKQIVKITDGTGTFYIVPSKALTADQLAKIKDAVKDNAGLIALGGTDNDTAADEIEGGLQKLKLNATDTDAIDKDIKVYGTVAALPILYGVNKDEYDAVELSDKSYDAFATANTVILANKNGGKTKYAINTSAVQGQPFAVSTLSDAHSTSHLLAYAFANGGWYVSKNAYGDNATILGTKATCLNDDPYVYKYNAGEDRYEAVGNTNDSGKVNGLSVSTSKQNGWMPKTTLKASKQIKNKIERDDVMPLSWTDDYRSSGQTYGDGKTAPKNYDFEKNNQTYDATFWDGTQPYGFSGLASQVADFFNKQDNGTITFTFAADAGNSAGKWSDGVPSTEVGLKGFSSEYLNDFALFFNYNNTTGTMLSALKLDPTAGSVTFDLTDYLADCGGLTKATLENIYYGLDNGIKYDANTNKYGLWVSKVELSYDDAGKAAVDATTDDDTAEDDAAVVVADDDDDDAEVEDDDVAEDDDIFEDDDVIEDDDDDDDDVDADVIEDDDDDDTDVNNDVDYVDAGADDDANPGTGVGLAVIPAIVAAAAVVVSKKRK